MEIVIALVAIAIGFIIGRATKHDRPLGDLRVDVSAIMRQRYATFRVKVENYLPHK